MGKGPSGPTKVAVYLAPRAGFEPATNRLTARQSHQTIIHTLVHPSTKIGEFTCVPDSIGYLLATFGNIKTHRFCCQGVAKGMERWFDAA
jgi:hypothetical protein